MAPHCDSMDGSVVTAARKALESQDPVASYLDSIRKAALAVPGVVAVHGVLAELIGADEVHAGIRLAVRPDMPGSEAHRIAEEVNRRIHEESDTGYCVIQLELAGTKAGSHR